MKQVVSNYDELFPGRFMKSGEVTANNNPVYTIKDIYRDGIENDKGKEEVKGIITFEEISQEMTVNKTKGECLRAIFTKDINNWIGKRIQLMVYEESFGKERVDAIGIGGSPDIDKDVTVTVTYRRRKAKTFLIKSLKKLKPVFDVNSAEQVDKFMTYAKANGWDKASVVLAGYDISDADVETLRGLL